MPGGAARYAAPLLLVLTTLGGASALGQDSAPVAIPEPSAKALRLYHSGNRFWAINAVWAVAVPGAILVSGLSARLRDAARRFSRGPWVLTVGLFAVLYLGTKSLIDLPLDYCETFVRPHVYGLSNQSPARWLDHWLKGVAVSMATAFLLLWVPYLLIARSPRRWWLYAGLLTIPFTLFGALVQPVLIDPLFNQFGPMKDRALAARIRELAARAGIEGGRIYEVDMSRDTNAVNAYVKGFLGTHRIVLWDTLLQKLDDQEVLFVMAHEMGHYVLGHIAQGIAVSSVLVLAGLFFVDRAARAILARAGHRFGVESLADVASAPLLLALGNIVALALVPAGFAFSRHLEHEADRFALELTQANRVGALSFVALQRENLSNPRPGSLYKIWRSTHPSLAERITFCNTYRPWQSGEPLRYGGYIRQEPSFGQSRVDPHEVDSRTAVDLK
jgi:STE24 endopeptidase